MKTVLLFTLISLLCVSCSSTMMGPTTVLSKGHIKDLNKASTGFERVSGTAKEHAFFLSHLVLGEAAPQRAIEAAVAQGGENCIGLSETFVTTHIIWWLPFLYTECSYTAEGTPIYRR